MMIVFLKLKVKKKFKKKRNKSKTKRVRIDKQSALHKELCIRSLTKMEMQIIWIFIPVNVHWSTALFDSPYILISVWLTKCRFFFFISIVHQEYSQNIHLITMGKVKIHIILDKRKCKYKIGQSEIYSHTHGLKRVLRINRSQIQPFR